MNHSVLTGLFLIMFGLLGAAWGQIPPQEQPTMPNPIDLKSPAKPVENPPPQPLTRQPMPRPIMDRSSIPNDGRNDDGVRINTELIPIPRLSRRFADATGERRREIEEDIKERWREIFGANPVADKIEVMTGYPDLKKPGIPVLPQVRGPYTKQLGIRQVIPHVGFGAGIDAFGSFEHFLVENDTMTIAIPQPNQYDQRVFSTFVSMVHRGELRLADKPSEQPKPESIPEPEPQPQEPPQTRQAPQHYRPHIPYDPDLHYQVALRRAMREQEALEAEKEAADQEQEEPELPLLERGRFAPLPSPQADSEEVAPAVSHEAPQSRAPSEVLNEQGVAAFQGRVYNNAMRAFQQLHEASPDDLETGFAYGLALFACNRFEQAAEILPKVIQEAERAGVELPAFSAFYANERDYRSHRAALERRLALNPGDEALKALIERLPFHTLIASDSIHEQ